MLVNYLPDKGLLSRIPKFYNLTRINYSIRKWSIDKKKHFIK